MKQQLEDLYSARQSDFKWIRDQYPNEDMAGPFLMSPNAVCQLQPCPLLVIGQETGGWHYYINDIQKQMAMYEEFNLGEKYYSSPFWNVIRKVENALGNDHYTCAWTNLSKFDLDNGKAYGEYEAAISSVDDILIDEIKIVNPKVCIFFTGPTLDTRLSNIFGHLKYDSVPGFEKRELSKLTHHLLPEMTYRTYHPKFLRLQGKENDFIKFITSLSDYE